MDGGGDLRLNVSSSSVSVSLRLLEKNAIEKRVGHKVHAIYQGRMQHETEGIRRRSIPAPSSFFFADHGLLASPRGYSYEATVYDEPPSHKLQVDQCRSQPTSPSVLPSKSILYEEDRFFEPPSQSHYRQTKFQSREEDRCSPCMIAKPDKQDRSDATETPPLKNIKSTWRPLLKLQVFVFALMLLAVVVGANFVNVKWSYVSPRLHGVKLSKLKEAIKNNGLRPDYEFAAKLLFQPAQTLTPGVGGGSTYPNSTTTVIPSDLLLEDVPFSVFIPSNEKRVFRKRRAEDPTYPPNFSLALVCSDFVNVPSPTIGPWTYSGFRCATPSSFNEEFRDLLLPTSPISYDMTIPQIALLESGFKNHAYGRRCLLWRNSDFSMLKQSDIPLMIPGTGGFFTPNYVGERLVHGLLSHPVIMFLIVVLSWSHSLFAAQSWTTVHLPRLGFYLTLGFYRWLILYTGLGQLEKFYPLQSRLRIADSNFSLSPSYHREESDQFDFSDHIVATLTALFILTTELFCLYEFSMKATPEQYSLSITPKAGQSPDPPLTVIVPSYFERPWKLPLMALYTWTIAICLVITCLIYGGMATAAFFHSPLESIIGFGIGLVGIAGFFWLSVYYDNMVHGFWFWRD
eukprot:Blabericola_migrator_1__6066@NODE_305_length_10106_cov_125_059269_g249_i0_p2_GENE_NODE_305_length_10106_cov_125_059269_g249_i0NODE_305_length_10106_cov_125_059269_g249_i0_p2_ORF_typecomplete_len627_score60_00Scs3p/PF10261_9/0_00013EI24/PF07264_11/9_5e02EI24/PF07264_11/7_3e02EI24/PF07264_11/0_0067PAP2/PF01569_21/1_1e03PAP2/PF01569_21/0_3_NODE_305_length_10106_cov_125_059269_g249_i03142194